MKRVTTGLLLCVGLTGMVSCTSEEGFRGSDSEGKVVLELSTDGRVLMNTRADDTKVSVIPEPSDFGISFEKQDGSFSKKFANVDLFNREEGFPIGTYTITATYGDAEHEGFELPYFTASQEVTVEPGIAGYVNLTASLANSMVSIRYTDDFRSRFAAYSTMAISEANADGVAFAQTEDRPAYMNPGRIDLRLSLTNAQGDQVTVAPYSFTAKAQHHYIVTMGVQESSETGEALLDVQITEEVESEFIDIPLGDELFTAPAPALNAHDFPADMKYEEFESFSVTGDPRIDILAYGGLKDVNLSIKSGDAAAKSYQLVGADASVKNEIEAAGIEAIGLYNNPDQMAVLKFGKFLSMLTEGKYTVKVDAIDKRGIVSNNVEFNVEIKSVHIDMNIVGHAEYMVDELTVNLTSNQTVATDNVRFEVLDAKDNWQQASVVESRAAAKSRAEGDFSYTFKLKIPAPESTQVTVRAFYGQSSDVKATATDDAVIFPEYKVEIDAFANKVLFKVVPTDPSKFDIVTKNFKLIDSNGAENTKLMPYNAEEGIYMLTDGIRPATTYSGFESCLSFTRNPHQTVASFTTEAATDLTNGDFGAATQTINFNNIQVGGPWKVPPTTYTTTASIVRSTPDGWANVNDLTCWKDSKKKNTWFMVPSTYDENGAVVIQSVGYNHDGNVPEATGKNFSTTYYCTNVPANADFEKASGELFLGSYTFDGSEKRENGIGWFTRPETLTFDYKYEPWENEQGEAYIRVLDASGTVIASGEYTITPSDNAKAQIDLKGYPFGKKAAKIEICFRSTKRGVTPKIYIPSGSALKEGNMDWKNFTQESTRTLGANAYNTYARGSKLTIDNVKLGYTETSAQLSKRKQAKKTSKRK